MMVINYSKLYDAEFTIPSSFCLQGFSMQNKYDTNFDTPDAHFNYVSLFSDAQAKKVGNPKQNLKTVKEPIKTKTESHETEPNASKDRAMHEGDNPSFLHEFMKFNFFLTVQFIFVFLSKNRSLLSNAI
jgi:hypothetical protein